MAKKSQRKNKATTGNPEARSVDYSSDSSSGSDSGGPESSGSSGSSGNSGSSGSSTGSSGSEWPSTSVDSSGGDSSGPPSSSSPGSSSGQSSSNGSSSSSRNTSSSSSSSSSSWSSSSSSSSSSSCPLELTAYRTGENFGEAVAERVLKKGDPKQYVVLTNNDRDRKLEGFAKDFSASTAATPNSDEDESDDDLVRLTLRNTDSSLDTGTMRIEVSDEQGVRLFNDDGTPLSDMEVDLADPTGELADLASGGEVDIWLEGMAATDDLVFSFIYEDEEGEEVCRKEAHILLAEFTLKNEGSEIDFVAAYPKETLLIVGGVLPDSSDSGFTSKPSDRPAVDPVPVSDIVFRITIESLPKSAVRKLTITSDDVSQDSYQDALVEAGNGIESQRPAVIYSASDDDVLTGAQRSSLKSNVDLNAVHGLSATADLTTLKDHFKRPIPSVDVVSQQPASHPVGGRTTASIGPIPLDFVFRAVKGSPLPDADSYSWSVVSAASNVDYSTSGDSSDTFTISVYNLGLWVIDLTYTLGGQSKTVRFRAISVSFAQDQG